MRHLNLINNRAPNPKSNNSIHTKLLKFFNSYSTVIKLLKPIIFFTILIYGSRTNSQNDLLRDHSYLSIISEAKSGITGVLDNL